jgi:hypothetical protein
MNRKYLIVLTIVCSITCLFCTGCGPERPISLVSTDTVSHR